MNKFKILLAAGLFALASNASAIVAPIDGDITFGGRVDSFDITANTVTITGDRALVTGASGTFSTELVAWGDEAVYNSFSYDPLANVNPLWSVGGFSFELTQTTFIDEATPDFLDLAGTGFVTHASYDSTPFDWSLSTDSSGDGVFAFSATNTVVPVPAAVWLFGSGLLGLVGVARRKKA